MLLTLFACTGGTDASGTDGSGDTDGSDTGIDDTGPEERPRPPDRISGDQSVSDESTRMNGTVLGDRAGNSLSGAGDVNGDTYGDVLIGAQRESTVAEESGAAYLMTGEITTDRPVSAAYATILGEFEGDAVGWKVVGPGDVNGDGYAEVLVTTPYSDHGAVNAGAASLFWGPIEGEKSIADADVPLWGESRDQNVGYSATGGDLNGDSYADFAVGTTGSSGTGRVDAWYGTQDGIAVGASLWVGEEIGDAAGENIAPAGDIDGDGGMDLAIASVSYDTNSGLVYVVPCTEPDPLVYLADAPLKISGRGNSRLGSALAGGGDVTGDGLDDLLIGSPSFSGADASEGAVFVVGSGATGSISIDDFLRITGGEALVSAGSALAVVDLDGDESNDVAVGVPNLSATESLSSGGAVALFYGPITADTTAAEAPARLLGEYTQGLLGYALANAGDPDGDTWENLLVGLPGPDGDGEITGTAYLFPAR